MSGLSNKRQDAAFQEIQRVLHNVKPDNLQSKTGVRKFKKKTNALLRQLEQATPQYGPWGQSARLARLRVLMPLILAKCAAWNLPFFARMRRFLLRDLRDIVYVYIWDDETLKDTHYHMWMSEFFEALRPLIVEFDTEGARVKFTLRYAKRTIKPPIELDLLPLIRKPESEWRQEAAKFFDSQTPCLRTRHQDYLVENNPDYGPNDASYTDGEDNQPGDDLSPRQEEDESLFSDISDEPHIRGIILRNCDTKDQDRIDATAEIDSDMQALQNQLATLFRSGGLS
ncbi:hypothetical protein Ptr902_05806 [Pyrenophora tritici-repentis]|nr:hypothetical protein Ptr902_05806 [Pyrenophora tritici-repentis]